MSKNLYFYEIQSQDTISVQRPNEKTKAQAVVTFSLSEWLKNQVADRFLKQIHKSKQGKMLLYFDLQIHAVPLLVIVGSSSGQSASYTFGCILFGFFNELVRKGHGLQACLDVWPMFGWYVP